MKQLSIEELYDIAKSLKIKNYSSLTSEQLLQAIAKELGDEKEEEYKRISKNKYKKCEQLGNTGKDAKTYLVFDKYNKQYAMKVFKKTKSGKKIAEEVQLQKLCSDVQISPKIVDYDTESKFIVMEKMDGHLFHIIQNTGILSEDYQRQLIAIFKAMDRVGVFHGDANMMNYMVRDNKLYIIDFGYGTLINDSQIKKLGTSKPNMEIMLLGFILKLKDMKCGEASYKKLVKYLSSDKRQKFGL